MLAEIEAIKHIHTLGIIHCDIKPSNVLYGKRLDMKYRLSIIDFGTSWIEGEPACSRVIGSKYFSSPRQLGASQGK